MTTPAEERSIKSETARAATSGNRYEDRTPIAVTVKTDRGALTALKDHPAMLQPNNNGSYFVMAVKRGVAALMAAVEMQLLTDIPRADHPVSDQTEYEGVTSSPADVASEGHRRDEAVEGMMRAIRAAGITTDYDADIEHLGYALLAFADEWGGVKDGSSPVFPREEGDVTVLGPGIFVSHDDEPVISWRGENYVRQEPEE